LRRFWKADGDQAKPLMKKEDFKGIGTISVPMPFFCFTGFYSPP